ncbi:hypothetical protein M752DRAFT_269383 [Aspergillus phoenicis ATCC 13157]|uniref:Uncharacterized protein n=1 Tax=Aspergillus phoenicis ATCC 13157 TaxID=1353007 RepID=A0A370P9E0_ASPPH|nr:hypothetical protein M752DRAFT_269383 [Aspergillus phoenicis ATCC 13157]GLA28120.1 hypothetical protein AnigIFM63326_005688 [Aspergillus niger]
MSSLRLVSLSGVMDITDDEWLLPHEYATRMRSFPPVILGAPDRYTGYQSWVERMGGEIRVELNVTFNLTPGDQSVKVNYDTKLFEGISENTDDLDGQHIGSTIIDKDGAGEIKFTVKNTDEGGDKADIRMYVVNARFDQGASGPPAR